MNILGAVIAGLVGTAVMTMMMAVAPKMGLPKMDIIGLLGTMFTEKKENARPIGALVHFMMGAIFAIIYAAIWSAGVGAVNWYWGLIFGAGHAIVMMVTMPMMLRVHPRPPQTQRDPMTAVGQILGHVVFGIVTALVYAPFLA